MKNDLDIANSGRDGILVGDGTDLEFDRLRKVREAPCTQVVEYAHVVIGRR